MASVSTPTDQLELHSGDHLSRTAFHHAYEQTPEDFQAELIGGIVYVASPLKRQHGTTHALLTGVLAAYLQRTPGVELGDNATILLADDSEPQPDLYLRILPEYGGQSSTTPDDYIEGPPELVAEIAHSSYAIDLHAKYEDYAKYGVLEYLVVSLREDAVHWFDLQAGTEREPDKDGVIRLRTFPGLWVHRAGLLNRDQGRLMKTLEQGLNDPAHAEFARKLEQARASKSKPS